MLTRFVSEDNMIRYATGTLLATYAGLTSADTIDNSLASLEGLLLGDNIPAVVTPARVEQPRVEVSSTLSVLSGEFIRRSNVQYVEDLLFYVPGFYVGPYWNSYRKVVAYHGTEKDRFRRIQVLVNGRSVYSSAYARVDWASLALSIEDVARVEVNRGPNASSYGSNSFLAVINIITRSPIETLGSDLAFATDDQGNRRMYAQHSGLSGNWSYRVSASRGTVDGYARKGDGDPRNDGHVQTSGNMFFLYEDNKQKVDIDIGAANLAADVEFYEVPGVSYDNTRPVLDRDREHIKVSWEVDQSAQHTLRAQYYYDRSERIEDHDIDVYGMVLNQLFAQDLPANEIYKGHLVSDLDENRHDVEVQSIWTPTSDYRLVNTLSYRQDRVSSKTYFDGDYKEELFRASTNLSYRAFDPLIINGGVMYEHSKLTGDYTSPQLGATYKLTQQSSIRANISQAYRVPDLYDQKAKWSYVFNGIRSIPAYSTGIPAEKITSYEVGFYHNIPTLGLSYDISAYREKLMNLSGSNKKYEDAIEDGGLLTPNESYAFTIDGIEAELDWRSAQGTLLRATIAYQDTKTDEEDIIETVAPFVTTLFASIPVSDSISINSRYIYGKEVASYDHEFLSLWLAYRMVQGSNTFTAGLGGNTRLDNNPYIRVNNVTEDKTSVFMFANVSF
ncbi:TonB-dependent receptor plug domain-containing protein [Marinomonas gallaica]|uniref:TonB-dependent receptor plug domain-containing protein n=1 Tax=Marinomonas gallaica TaxID=1806667 RepID=UPI0008347193|nr:TonB-dependent receptor [Marinomonas gallaica]